MSSLTEKMIELELHMKYPGEDLSEIEREYNVLSERLRALELKQQRDADEARGIDASGCWTQNESVGLASEFWGLKQDFNHFINKHFLPLQSKIFHWLNPVPGGPMYSERMGRGFYGVFPPSPHSPPVHSSPSSHNSIPSLWSATDSEEDKGNKDFQGALDGPESEAVIVTNGGEEADSVSAGRLGGDTW
jgi:hypothetical protein